MADFNVWYEADVTGAGTTHSVSVQLPILTKDGTARRETFVLKALRFVRTGGTAANYTLHLSEASAGALSDINVAVQYASDVVANPINEAFLPEVPIRTDSAGRIYLKPGFDAGADNAFSYKILIGRI